MGHEQHCPERKCLINWITLKVKTCYQETPSCEEKGDLQKGR